VGDATVCFCFLLCLSRHLLQGLVLLNNNGQKCGNGGGGCIGTVVKEMWLSLGLFSAFLGGRLAGSSACSRCTPIPKLNSLKTTVMYISRRWN
jgi:hypothetical protein